MLVIGAGGGIATMAISLAVAAGAAIAVTSSSSDTIGRAVSAGARGGVLHSETGWPEDARALSPNKAGFDLILDPVGRWNESVRALRPGGRLVVLGANAAETAPMDVRSFYFGQFDLLGTTMGSNRDFTGLLNMIDRCSVRAPAIDREFPLDQAAQAHEHLERGRTFGKCVLTHD
jgi:NADPH:quinone reductase-like Zn-dependent oxidoreductase